MRGNPCCYANGADSRNDFKKHIRHRQSFNVADKHSSCQNVNSIHQNDNGRLFDQNCAHPSFADYGVRLSTKHRNHREKHKRNRRDLHSTGSRTGTSKMEFAGFFGCSIKRSGYDQFVGSSRYHVGNIACRKQLCTEKQISDE